MGYSELISEDLFSLYPWQEQLCFDYGESSKKAWPMAILLHGPRFIGKTHLAYSSIARYLCEKNQNPPCQECPSCSWLSVGVHPNVRWLSPSSGKDNRVPLLELLKTHSYTTDTISIDQIRELHSFLHLSSYQGKRKFIIISSMEGVSFNASHALLKILEDMNDVTFLLTSSNPYRVIPTIRSRCQNRVICRLPESQAGLSWLEAQECSGTWMDFYLAGGRVLLAQRIAQKGSSARFFKWTQDFCLPNLSLLEKLDLFYECVSFFDFEDLFATLLCLEGIQRILMDAIHLKALGSKSHQFIEDLDMCFFFQRASLHHLDQVYKHLQEVHFLFLSNSNKKISIRNAMYALHSLI